jgi:hypothetical protein
MVSREFGLIFGTIILNRILGFYPSFPAPIVSEFIEFAGVLRIKL